MKNSVKLKTYLRQSPKERSTFVFQARDAGVEFAPHTRRLDPAMREARARQHMHISEDIGGSRAGALPYARTQILMFTFMFQKNSPGQKELFVSTGFLPHLVSI